MTVGELLARAHSRELGEWKAYEKEYGPLGSERGDYQAALIAYMIAAVNTGKKGRKPRLSDFLLRWSKRRQTADEQLALFQGLAARQERLIRGDDS